MEEQLYFSAAGRPENISRYCSPSFSALEKLWLCSVSIISAFKACIAGVKTSAPPWVCAISPIGSIDNRLCVLDGVAFMWLCDFSCEINWLALPPLMENCLLQRLQQAE